MLVGMGSRSHDVGDEPKKAFLYHLLSHVQKLSFLISFQFFCTDGIYDTLSEHWERAVLILSTKYFEKFFTK